MKPGIDLDKFNPSKADANVLKSLGVDVNKTPNVLLYAGRVSVEKNLPLWSARSSSFRRGGRTCAS